MSEDGGTTLKIKAQVIADGVIAIGPGKAQLLAEIARTGSIAAAGRAVGTSYRRTRDMVDILNTGWGAPLIETAKGGASGGGSRLTDHGRAVLEAYRQLEIAVQEAGRAHAGHLIALMNGVDPDGAQSIR